MKVSRCWNEKQQIGRRNKSFLFVVIYSNRSYNPCCMSIFTWHNLGASRTVLVLSQDQINITTNGIISKMQANLELVICVISLNGLNSIRNCWCEMEQLRLPILQREIVSNVPFLLHQSCDQFRGILTIHNEIIKTSYDPTHCSYYLSDIWQTLKRIVVVN